MTQLPQTRMMVDEFLAWAEGRPGRYELVDGTVYAMTPERAAHAMRKYAVQSALDRGIRGGGLPCQMLPDGMTVRIDQTTAFEPDALVYSGPKLQPSALEVPNPVIVVEVLSPSTGRADALSKLPAYFRVPSIKHYLIVDPDSPLVIHHARGEGETLLTRIIRDGDITLDPPGLTISMADIYPPE